MVFLNWILIGGLAAVAAPVIIHLLQRNRVTPLDWGAMMFLEELLAERARQIKLRELLLLLVRASILACLALALMRPTILASSGARAPDVHTSAVLLLDDSFSMNAGRARTAWQEARERAIRYVDTLRKGDDVTLLFTSAAGKGAPPAALFDLERVRELIREARPRHESADVARALDAAVKQLETRHNPRRELLFVTDLQAAGWELDDGARWSYLAGLVRSSRIAPQILLTSVGQERPSNVALTGLTPSRSVVDPYAAVTFHVTAANEGPEKAGDAAVTFFVNGAPKATRNVELAPGAREVLAFTYQFERPGSHLVSCRLRSGADELPDDNELLHSVVVLDRLPVLLVDGDRRTQPLASEADFLREALSPRDADDPTWRTVIETTAIDSTELKYADLSKYRVVVLANVAALPGATVGDLERFVVAGGGLLLAPGDRVQLGAYNRDLYRNGAGLLPVSLDKLGLSEPTPLVKVARGPEPAPAYLHLGGIVSNAPALELFRPERGQDWTQARIRQYVATGAPSGQDDVRVLASYSNGAAALVQKNLGEGKVYLLTTAVDTGWSDLPVHPFYVPLMQCLVFDLASAVIPPRNLRVGQALSYVTGAEAARHPHLLYRPQGDPLELAPRRQGALTVYTHDDTAAPGSYLVAPEGAGADERVHYTVTADRAESVMVRLEPGDLRRLERDLGAHYAPDWDSLGRLIGLDGGGYELSAWLILAAAGFCFLETWLLRRWS
ncbi:MAG: BatA domain-containing protein [Planctomycetota bacterium]|nr:BatA domain-containing protein [Planctomycetota bacterium]